MAKPSSSATIDPSVTLFNSMTACWPMLEGSGTTSADKAGSRTLTFAGGGSAPTWSTDGAGDAIVSIATAQANPLALASSLTLGGSTSFSLAWRGKQASDDNQGAVAGTTATTGFLTMFGGANYLGARSNASVDANFTINTFTADANYLLVYDQPAGYVHLYKDGTEVSGSPASVGSTFALTIDRLGNGYSGTTFALAGSLTYVYAWHGYAATSTDATNLHTDPYHGLSANPTVSASPARGEASRSITVSMAGHLTSWSSPTGLFTVSGGTGASISNIAVQSSTAATFTLQPGSALGTLTITDTSTSATTTFTVAAMFAGGLLASSFSADSAVSGSDSSGRTFIGLAGAQRVRQHGPITQVTAHINTVDGSNGVRFKVFRPNGSNFDYVSQSELLTPAGTGARTFNLTSPMACQPGDVVGIWLQNNNAVSVKTASLTPAIKYEGGNQTGTNWNPASSLNDFSLDIEFRVAFCTAVATGDSRDAGHNSASGYLTWLESGGPSGNLAAQPIHALQVLNDAARTTWVYQNYAVGSQTWAYLASTEFPQLFTTYGMVPRYLYTQCGVNDVAAGRTNAAVLADMDTCYALVPANTRWYIDEVLPWTAGNDTQAAAIRSLNTAMAGWAAGKTNVKIVSCHDAMGQTRVSTGQLDDMATAYDYDGVHMTVSAGVNKLADLRFAADAVSAALAVTLGACTASSAATLALKATSAVTLGACTASAAGTLPITAAAPITLAACATSAAGAVAIQATASVTLGNASTTAAGALAITGAAAVSLGACTLQSDASVHDNSGVAAITLAAVTASAAGRVDIAAALGITLGDCLVSAVIAGSRIGAAAIALSTCGLSAAGEDPDAAPPVISPPPRYTITAAARAYTIVAPRGRGRVTS